MLHDITLATTILELKHKIQDKEGIPPSAQRLIFNGKDVDDRSTVAECNIKKNLRYNLFYVYVVG